jgi:hypothetical protein
MAALMLFHNKFEYSGIYVNSRKLGCSVFENTIYHRLIGPAGIIYYMTNKP